MSPVDFQILGICRHPSMSSILGGALGVFAGRAFRKWCTMSRPRMLFRATSVLDRVSQIFQASPAMIQISQLSCIPFPTSKITTSSSGSFSRCVSFLTRAVTVHHCQILAFKPERRAKTMGCAATSALSLRPAAALRSLFVSLLPRLAAMLCWRLSSIQHR